MSSLVAATLGDVGPETADRALDTLVGHHLVEEIARDRYRMHSLLRTFTQKQAWHERKSEDLDEAVVRVVNLYAAACAHADATLHPFRVQAGPIPDEGRNLIAADTRHGVRRWLDSERANLTAVADFAATHTWNQPAAMLVHILVGHLDRRGSWPQALELLEHAHDAWMPELGPATATAAQILTDLTALHARTADLDRAMSFARAALNSWTACGDLYGEAEIVLQFGRIHWLSGRRAEAVAAYENAAEMFARAAAPDRQAYARYHLAIGLHELGRTDEAFAYCRSVVATARDLDDTELLSDGLINLGNAHLLAGQYAEARACFVEAEPLTPARDNPQSRAVLANNFGSVQQHARDHDAALVSFRVALHLAQMTGDQLSESESLIKMATTHVCLHDHAAAHAELSRATRLAADMKDPLVQSQIDLATGRLFEGEGHQPEAVEAYRSSVAHAEAAGVPLDQANALRALGEALVGIDRSAARGHLLHALGIYRRLGHPDGDLVEVPEP